METTVVKGESIYWVMEGDEKATARSFKTASASARASLGYGIMRSIEAGRAYNIVFTSNSEKGGSTSHDATQMFLTITATITLVGFLES